jgi:hypothetical protein
LFGHLEGFSRIFITIELVSGGFPLLSDHVTIHPSIHPFEPNSVTFETELSHDRKGCNTRDYVFSEFSIFRRVEKFERLGSLNDPLKVLTVVD